MSWVRIPPNPCRYIHVIYEFWTTIYWMAANSLAEMLSPYQNFVYALKSKEVKRQYPSLLDKFLHFITIDGSMEEKCHKLYSLAKTNNPLLQSHLIKYCIFQKERVERSEISEGTLRNYLKPIKLFFEMNDVVLPWKKITKGLPSPKQAADDRCPTKEEIKKLLDFSDKRVKVIALVMLSSGIRVGAWNWLRWKHVKPIYDANKDLLAAKLRVYVRENEEYFTFLSPEAYTALKEYMDFRKLHGETINGESWLIRDTWQKIDKRHGHRIGLAKFPKKMDSEGIRRMIYDAWKIQGVIEKLESKNSNHEFKSSHGFRKFFETHAMQVMYSSNVELLMGHFSSMGMKKNYYKPTEQMLLDDYLKAVPLLTIISISNEKVLTEKIRELSERNENNEHLIRARLDEKDDVLKALADRVLKLTEEMDRLKIIKKIT